MSCLECVARPRFQFSLKGLAKAGAALAAFLPAAFCGASPQTYATSQLNIKAGIVIPDDTEGYPGLLNGLAHGISQAPFALYNLNNAVGVKPIGWNIYNPNAPGMVTPDMVTRWQTIASAATVDLPVVGAPIDKSKAEYWAVYMSQVPDQVLDSYNLLLLNPAFYAQLTPAEISRLIRFVDQGGILWIDPSGPMASYGAGIDPLNNFPIAISVGAPNGTAAYADTFDPLLNTPNRITASDLNYLHHYFQLAAGQATAVGGQNWEDALPFEFWQFKTVTAVGSTMPFATISVAHLGNGAIVLTPTGVSQILNRNSGEPLGGSITAFNQLQNEGFTAKPTQLASDGVAAAKLVVNMIAELGDFPEPAGGSRKMGGDPIDVTAPSLPRWKAEGQTVYTTGLTTSPNTAPVLYKGVFVASTGNCLTVLKAVPGTDLDGDGDTDDGLGTAPGLVQQPIRDYSEGYSYNTIWVSAPMTPPLSAPVCFEVNDPGAVVGGVETPNKLPRDEVAVIDGNGTLHVFGLFDKTGQGGQLIGGEHSLAQSDDLNGYNVQNNDFTPGTEAYELPSPNGAAVSLPSSGSVPNAPTISEDLAFVADSTSFNPTPSGRIWIADLTIGNYLQDDSQPQDPTSYWLCAGGGPSALPGFTGPPTVGYIPVADTSGGSDKVIYVPGVGSNFGPEFVSMWFGVKGESPTGPNGISVVNSAGTVGTGGTSTDTITVSTRLSGVPGGPDIYYAKGNSNAQVHLRPKVVLIDPNGNPLTANQMTAMQMTAIASQGTGVFTFTVLDTGWTQFGPQGLGVRVDYTIDWGTSSGGNASALERGYVQLPVPLANASITTTILGPIALTPSGTLVMTTSNPSVTGGLGSLYWFKEDQGRGAFRMTGRYSLYNSPSSSPLRFTLLQSGQSNPIPATFENYDPLVYGGSGDWLTSGPNTGLIATQMGVNGFSSELDNLYFTGPPVVQGNQVYALAAATTPFNGNPVNCTIAMAFSAEPPEPVIQTTGLVPGTQFVQYDPDRSDGSTTNQTYSSIGTEGYVYDSNTNRAQFPNLANSTTFTRGQINDCLDLSLPVIVRVPGQPDVLLDPTAAGDTWSPLQWYSVFLGTGSTTTGALVGSAPLVTGNTLFLASSSVLPGIMLGQGIQNKAVVLALDAQVSAASEAGSNVTVDPDRGYQYQVNQVNKNLTPDPHIKMPQGAGVTSLAQYAARVLQTTLGNSQYAYGVAGGGTTLAVGGDQGIYGLSRANFLVCDQGRLARVDSSGNILWASNSNVNSGQGAGGYAANVTQLVRPTKAYPLDQSETLVVDTGGNRVIKLDDSGLETRSISSFFTDPSPTGKGLPQGFQPNEPLKLSAPRDAITYAGYVTSINNPLTPGDNEPANSTEYWVHYLIADSGNKRLVELIDRYLVDPNTGEIGGLVTVNMPDPNVQPGYTNPSGGNPGVASPIGQRDIPQAGVLWWQSPSSVSGKNYDYNSISRVFLNSVGNNGRYVYVAGIGSAQPTRASVGLDSAANAPVLPSATGSGGVVVFDPQSPTGIQVYDKWERPDTSNTPFWDATTGAFDTKTPASRPGGTRPLNGVTSVTARAIQSGGKSFAQIMVSCSDGVFEAVVDPTTTTDDLGGVDWYLNNAAFSGIWTPANAATVNTQGASQFVPAYAARLDSGEVMIVNAYMGTTLAGGVYNGEVLQLDGSPMTLPNTNPDMGFNLSSIHFFLPPINGARNLVAPVFADRR